MTDTVAQKMLTDLVGLLHENLENPDTSWSIGSFGAIGEYHIDPAENREVVLTETGGASVTDRGGLSVSLPARVHFEPYEILSSRREFWLQGGNFCIPAENCTVHQRSVLSELGPDRSALRSCDREAVLFDMGLKQRNIDVCIRTADPELIALLRSNCGKSLFEAGNPAMSAIKMQSPHRVFLSDLGRVEVYQHIGSTERNIATPLGPHTHILPKLLKNSRTHSANTPIPDDFYPALSMYPVNPMLDNKGNPRGFDSKDYQNFQVMWNRFGDGELTRFKQTVHNAIQRGHTPENFSADSRRKRVITRVTIRQLLASGIVNPTLQDWQNHFEPGDENTSSDHHGH
ncbi:DUF6925 family protein [Kiloniella sp. b19]|uniref:DUF6925 family protein n=1 Tax=Kiloniella sp. GXU_MW_B19 TaxID=3141326 RepID=UPI0031D412BF